MATSLINGVGNITTGSLTLKGPHDYPLSFIETGNEETKGMRFYDANNQLRNELKFAQGHLYFSSWDASGTVIVNNVKLA